LAHFGKTTVFNEEQPENRYFPNVVTLSGNSIFVSDTQLAKTPLL
jgi:hypothetical protein